MERVGTFVDKVNTLRDDPQVESPEGSIKRIRSVNDLARKVNVVLVRYLPNEGSYCHNKGLCG